MQTDYINRLVPYYLAPGTWKLMEPPHSFVYGFCTCVHITLVGTHVYVLSL